MCLIVFAWRPGHEVPLVLAANRDEFYARPTLPMAKWEDAPGVIAGRDLEAGGTWLGAGPKGRFAALTNIRDPRTPPVGRTRGELCVQFLRGTMGPGRCPCEYGFWEKILECRSACALWPPTITAQKPELKTTPPTRGDSAWRCSGQ